MFAQLSGRNMRATPPGSGMKPRVASRLLSHWPRWPDGGHMMGEGGRSQEARRSFDNEVSII